ncbi:hypothetical protein INT44_002160 [Umbelopsis vinacea]|uniref:Zn(2)-C6 fungal-type domain-containing protein n=1 Tax=Umbelopsis vinacea TaxID=44442 RepID=A0A8H7Q2R1_9FUNG|nr:hypothetical protein INT44_002160 [Umbelopsis vinacea]
MSPDSDKPPSQKQQEQEADQQQTGSAQDAKKKRNGPKRRKVSHACVYCRRSHMTCDDGRPCQRCIKRSIGHLCHDEPKPSSSANRTPQSKALSTGKNEQTAGSSALYKSDSGQASSSMPLQLFGNQMAGGPLTFASEHMGNEISVISAFLDSLGGDVQTLFSNNENGGNNQSATPPINNPAENYYITAADPRDGRLEDRLTEVINAKYEAGFLRPYNYVNGYARLQKFMDSNMSPSSRQRILNVMGTFRPAFRHVAQSLTDIDLILVEEAFERLLLVGYMSHDIHAISLYSGIVFIQDYDRVFSSMGIPACLWRRTGEIYRGNKEFAQLVNVPIQMLREGRLCIYELMAEESAVNYWETVIVGNFLPVQLQ